MTVPFPETLSLSPSSLYVHVPFCASKCAYCDFFSVPIESRDLAARVLSREVEDIAEFSELSGTASFETVYIGGGTPSIIEPSVLEGFLESLARLSAIPPSEVTIEANPESVTPDFLSVLRGSFVTRISLGVQSMSDNALKRALRPADSATIHGALGLIGKEWTGKGRRLSADFIAGLPLEDDESVRLGVSEVIASGAGHVSVYSLTVEEGTPFSREPAAIPGEEEAERLWFLYDGLLAERGFSRYEVSNYAVRGEECAHNLRYWAMEPWFGAGPGAVSCFPRKGGGSIRLSGVKDIGAYLGGAEPLLESISPQNDLFERIMMGLRTSRGVDTEALGGRFSVTGLDSILLGAGKGMLHRRGDGRIAADEKGMNFLNGILIDILRRLEA